MHALEAKTGENRRFWGRVSEELNSVETTVERMIESGIREFQKNLIVWKQSSITTMIALFL